MKEKGFTLLELIIALSLMSVISITATQMLRRTTSQTKKITEGMKDSGRLRAALDVIKEDALKAFHYRDINLFLYNEAEKERVKRYGDRVKAWIKKHNDTEKPNPLVTEATLTPELKQSMEKELGKKPTQPELVPEKVVTHFKGDKEKFYFTTASGFRFRSEDKVSNLLEVGYFLRTCRGKKYRNLDSDCLWRSVSYNLDGEVTEDGKDSVLLEHIQEMKLEYLSFENSDEPKWLESWDSTSLGDARYGEMFPAALAIKLKVKFPRSKDGKKFKTQSLSAVFPIAFPNNKPFEALKK